MKKLIIILFILIIGFYSYGQDVRGSRGIFGTVYVGNSPSYGRWIDSVKNDTTGWLGRTRAIGTLDAIYKFVAGRVGSGGGSSAWGSITGTLSSQTDLQTALNLKANIASPTLTGTVTLSGLAGNGVGYAAVSNTGVISWSAGPNLIVQNAGSGTQIWYTSGDTLYMKKVKNTTFISGATDTDSSLLISLSATGTPSASTYLRGDNTWASIPGGGDVLKVGTPVNNQVGVWTGNGTIEGDANLTFASSTLNIGVAGASTGIFTQSGVTSGTITFQPAAVAGTYTLTWPTTDGNNLEVLQTNGSGVLTWVAAGAGNVSKVGTPVDDQVGVWTGDGTIEGDVDLVFDGSSLGIGGTPVAKLDVWSGAAPGMVVGADLNAATRTNVTNKFFRLAAYHYTNAEEPFAIISTSATSSTNSIFYGLGTNPGMNGAQSHDFYTTVNNTTLSGTSRMTITNTLLQINSNLTDYDMAIGGDTDGNLFRTDASVDRVLIGTAAGSGTEKLSVTGNIALLVAGNKLKIATGSNASIGVSVAMTAGTITISTTAVATGSIIILTHATVGGTQGILSVGTIVNGTSFVINSSSGTDTGTVNWWIIN